MKLMALDGNSIVNRAFYGIRMLNAPDGTPTNGIYGFITILQRLLDEEKPDGVCVAFDLHAPTFRHLEYAEYKGNRKGMPEELQVQMPLLKQTLDAMGIRRMELEGFEADDLLGTISRACEKSGDECVIVTGDKDSFQLISDNTRVLHVKSRMGQTETINYTKARFEEEYGFAPERMIDLKALMGDSSDNIPGVPGIGEKTALELVRRFGSLDGVYAQLDSPDIKNGVRSKLTAGRNSAYMSFHLATIVTDAPAEPNIEDTRWNNDFTPELYDMFLRLGFTKFIDKWGLRPAGESAAPAETRHGGYTVCALANDGEVSTAAEALRSRGGTVSAAFCADMQTAAFCSASDGENIVYSLDRDSFSGDYAAALSTVLGSVSMAGHNVKDILRRLADMGIRPGVWAFDTALAAYLLDATAGSYDLDRLCLKYCGFRPESGETEREPEQMSLLDTPEADNRRSGERVSALIAEAEAIFCLYPVLEKKMAELGMTELYCNIELPLCAVLADMERQGFLVDKKALSDFGAALDDGIAALQSSIWELAGERFNINSPKQLGTVLFEKLMLPAGKKTKTGWSTNADVLERLIGKHPVISQILDFRMLTKLKSTYADGLLKVIAPDGRIHTSFQMTVTATGRLSSTEPNLQNIPVRRELGSEIRKMFVAAPGNVLVDADYSQIELRLLAHISGDETMISAFRSGEDIHAVTASQVFGVPLDEVTHTMRSNAKAVNFGIVYGISAFSLAQDIGVSQSEAKAYIDAYLGKYSGVREYMKTVVERAREDGYVSTLFGRRRYLPELKSSNFNLRAFGERVALNMPIQGTAADVMKLAMVRVHGRLKTELPDSKLILQVHDELIVECPAGDAEKAAQILEQEMSSALECSVPMPAEANSGRSWHDAKG